MRLLASASWPNSYRGLAAHIERPLETSLSLHQCVALLGVARLLILNRRAVRARHHGGEMAICYGISSAACLTRGDSACLALRGVRTAREAGVAKRRHVCAAYNVSNVAINYLAAFRKCQ